MGNPIDVIGLRRIYSSKTDKTTGYCFLEPPDFKRILIDDIERVVWIKTDGQDGKKSIAVYNMDGNFNFVL